MAAIDQYDHILIGFIKCPSSYDFIHGNNTRLIGIYELLEDVPSDENSFDGKSGDILVSGGRGEAPALRISYPDAFEFFTKDDWNGFFDYDEVFKSFWTPTQAFIFGEGYRRLGCPVDIKIEQWLAENVCRLLIQSNDKYLRFRAAANNSSSLRLTVPK
jgi:hypothetical protein